MLFSTDAAGNFLCPATALSFNAFKTVMEIDTMGTFNTSKVVYEKWFKVQYMFIFLCDIIFLYLKLKSCVICLLADSAVYDNAVSTAVYWGPLIYNFQQDSVSAIPLTAKRGQQSSQITECHLIAKWDLNSSPSLSIYIYSIFMYCIDFNYHCCVQDHGGNIVNISATLGYKGQALQVHAGSAKAANGKSVFSVT